MIVKPYSTHMAVFGAVLALLRENRKIKQGAFAKKIEMSSPSVSKIEKGETPLSYDNLRKCSDTLGIKTSKLLEVCENVEEALRDRGIRVLTKNPEEIVTGTDSLEMILSSKMLKEYIRTSKVSALLE